MRVPSLTKRRALGVTLALALVATAVIAVKQSTVLAGSDPWTSAEVITPESLAKEISGSTKPAVVSVGFKSLYDTAHVAGALFHGPGHSGSGIADLKHWAGSQRKDQTIVLYCGCCPWQRCPNIRPAFEALKQMGFTKLRVMEIDNDFEHDWHAKGYPVATSK